MTARAGTPWIVYALGALLLAAIAAAVLVVGPASGQQSAQTRTITAQRGVVQSTVSGSGNIQASSQLDLGFQTSGTVAQIYVTQGQHVTGGQLLATLDPQAAEVTLEQAEAALKAAEANLAGEQETDGESSPGQSSSGSGNAAPASTASTSSRPSDRTTTVRGGGNADVDSASGSSSGASNQGTAAAGSSSTDTSISTATREANIASAHAAVKSDRLTVQSDEQAVANTRLRAPQGGTLVSLSGEVGETVAGGGTSRAADTSSESSGTAGSTAATAGGAAAGSSSSGSSSSSGTSASSSSFAVLSDLSSMKLVVPLSESEVGSVKAGQPATVSVEALKGAKLAAHVSEVASLPTSDSGVVSYDVTFTLDQLQAGLKPGMSASAEVVVAQAEGVNVPTSAISAGMVTVIRSGHQLSRAVTTGLAGNSTTIVLSGLRAGEQVVLPITSSAGTSSLLSKLAGRSSGSEKTLGGGFSGGGFSRGGFAGPGAGGGPGG